MCIDLYDLHAGRIGICVGCLPTLISTDWLQLYVTWLKLLYYWHMYDWLIDSHMAGYVFFCSPPCTYRLFFVYRVWWDHLSSHFLSKGHYQVVKTLPPAYITSSQQQESSQVRSWTPVSDQSATEITNFLFNKRFQRFKPPWLWLLCLCISNLIKRP